VLQYFAGLNYSSHITRFELNATIESILDELMIEEYSLNVSYRSYFDECAQYHRVHILINSAFKSGMLLFYVWKSFSMCVSSLLSVIDESAAHQQRGFPVISFLNFIIEKRFLKN
jgi:hypothetical protein